MSSSRIEREKMHTWIRVIKFYKNVREAWKLSEVKNWIASKEWESVTTGFLSTLGIKTTEAVPSEFWGQPVFSLKFFTWPNCQVCRWNAHSKYIGAKFIFHTIVQMCSRKTLDLTVASGNWLLCKQQKPALADLSRKGIYCKDIG